MRSEDLAGLARQAQETAYAPYSNYRVGAALLTVGGNVYTGANIENASYSLTICAERVAIFKAISAGEREFQALAISCSGKGQVTPCGACLQVLAEFAAGVKIITSDDQGDLKEYCLKEMLPYAFSLEG